MLEVRLLGTFDIKCDGQPVIISSRIAQSFFAYLVLHANTSQRREKLAGMFWPDATEEKARAYLRHELWRIRKALSTKSKVEYLIADDMNISFNSSADYWLDVAILKNVSEVASIVELMNALSVFQGELLPGFYDDWIIQEREHLQAVYEQKMARLLELLENERRWNDIVECAEHWISLAQESEAAFRHLMIAYDALGDRAKVSSTYQRCVQALRELDLEPSEQTRALAFKRSSKLNIPIPLTSFIGREKELKEIVSLFSKSRLITLTGSGGVGKTRLAIQVVADVLELFPDGVWFIDLAPLNDPALVPNTLVNVLGLRESGELPISDILINYFRSRIALIIFDSCEHLIESCAKLVDTLLTSCESLSILATSRESLQVSGEIPYRVPSLEIPRPDIEFTIDELSDIESVRLFIERAAFASLNFAINSQNVIAVAQICQRLDGIPLAIELAAARINVLSVEQILGHLDDRFRLLTSELRSVLPRYQTLRATIEWSYDLLSEPERILFRRLAVFMGGWTLEAAEEVCGENGIESGDVLELLSQLVNKSLVLVETSNNSETRYLTLETIRQYAREKLTNSGEEESMCERHTRWIVSLTELAEPKLRGHGQLEWLEIIEHELDNIRSALKWSLHNNFDLGLRITSALMRFWVIHGHEIECLQYVEKLFTSGRLDPTLLHARALACAAWVAMSPTTKEWMIAYSETGVTMSREVGDIESLALSLAVSAVAPHFEGHNDRALQLFEESLAICEETGILWIKQKALSGIGYASQGLGNYERANAAYQESLALSREAGDVEFSHFVLTCLAHLSLEQSHYEQALNYYQESLSIARDMKHKSMQARILESLGEINIMLGQYIQAQSLLEESIRIERDMGSIQWEPARAFERLGRAARLQGDHEKARTHYVEGLRLAQKYASRQRLAWCLAGLAELAALNNQPERAVILLHAAESLPELIIGLLPHEHLELEHISRTIRNQLDEESYAAAHETGKRMSLEEVVHYALKELR